MSSWHIRHVTFCEPDLWRWGPHPSGMEQHRAGSEVLSSYSTADNKHWNQGRDVKVALSGLPELFPACLRAQLIRYQRFVTVTASHCDTRNTLQAQTHKGLIYQQRKVIHISIERLKHTMLWEKWAGGTSIWSDHAQKCNRMLPMFCVLTWTK